MAGKQLLTQQILKGSEWATHLTRYGGNNTYNVLLTSRQTLSSNMGKKRRKNNETRNSSAN